MHSRSFESSNKIETTRLCRLYRRLGYKVYATRVNARQQWSIMLTRDKAGKSGIIHIHVRAVQ